MLIQELGAAPMMIARFSHSADTSTFAGKYVAMCAFVDFVYIANVDISQTVVYRWWTVVSFLANMQPVILTSDLIYC